MLSKVLFNRTTLLLSSSTKPPDYYSALGVSKSADLNSIKLAYFRQAKLYHPDNNQTKEARYMFQFISEAYEVLSDETKRRHYDDYGTAGEIFGGTASGPPRPSQSQTYTPEELFTKIFRGAKRDFGKEDLWQPSMYDGHDACQEFVVTFSFEEAAKGVTFEFPLNQRIVCFKCQGSKSDLGYQGNICPYCEGTGVETEKVEHIVTRRPCTYCEGTRIFIRFKCTECAGTGQVIKSMTHSIRIPPGCEHGQIIKHPIDENVAKFNVTGDRFVYIKVMIDPSEEFERKGFDIYSKSDITVAQALKGGTLNTKGLHSKEITLDLPPDGVGSHTVLCAPQLGICQGDTPIQGDHYVEIGVNVQDISEAQEEMIRQFSLDETLLNGTVDNGQESDIQHKFMHNVVEAESVSRKFFKAVGKTKE